jgi:tetratricopeptide (TPR) repeat protein/predicted Ser/Thr protein kinase
VVEALAGRYVIERELGRGAMGVVYRAFDQQTRRTVAVKVLLDPGFLDSEARTRFEAEARIAAKLRHEGIVSVHGAGEHGGHLYIVMDLIEGESLERLVRKGPLPRAQAVAIVKTVARALDHAHERGIVHRDLKPANILLDEAGRPRVVDFGLARDLAATARHLTATGVLVGTPAAMAPEQANGEPAGPAADIYALGSLLYWTLAGRPPFESPSIEGLLCKILTEKPPPLRRLDPGIPAALDAVAARCLEKKPEDRFPSAGAVALALGSALEAEGESSPRRLPVARLLAALAAVALVLAGGVLVRGRRPPTETAPPAPPGSDALLADARRALRDYRLAEADALSKRAVERFPGLAEAWACRAGVRSAHHDRAAIADLTRAIELDPRSASHRGSRARQRAFVNDLAGADADVAAAAAIAPDDIDVLIARATLATVRRDPAGALTWAARAKDRAPDSESAWLLHGSALAATGRTAEATASLEHALALNPRFEPAWHNLQVTLREANDLAGALAVADRGLAVLPDDLDLLLIRSDNKLRLGDFTGGLADANRCIELAPGRAAGWGLRGNLRFLQNDLDGALSDLTRAIDLDPKDEPTVLGSRAEIRADRGDVQGAIADYELFLELAPSSPQAARAREVLEALRASPGAR